MAKQRKVEVEYSLVNKSFNSGISEINKSVNTLNKEFRLQREQMKNTASESEKYEAQIAKLNKEYDLAEQKTRVTANALDNMKELFGENSEQARIWGDKLLDAQRNQEYLSNAITDTTTKLKDYVRSEQDKERALLDSQKALTDMTESESEYEKALRESTEASERRQTQLADLADEQDRLESSSDKLNAQYEYEKQKLGENASAISKARVEKEHLARQTKATADQISNLEQQLSIAKKEYGDNSKEVNELESKLYEAKRANEEFTQSLKKKQTYLGIGKEAIQAYGDKLVSVGSSMTKYVTLPLTAGAGLAIKAASDWESAFADVRKTVDGTDEELAGIEQALRDMGKVMPTSISELAEIAANAGQLGIETENVISFTETMAMLAETTDLTADSASSMIAQYANITGLPENEISNFASAIVELGNNSQTTESKILDMAQNIASAGSIAGMTDSEILAIATSLSSVGLEAAAGGTAISRMITELQVGAETGSDEFMAFADVAGYTANEFKALWDADPAGALIAFVSGLSDVERNGGSAIKVLSDLEINETRLRDTLLRATSAQDTFNDALVMSEEAYASNTALNEEYQVRMETFETKMNALKGRLNDIFINLGEPLMDAAIKALDAFEPFLLMIEDLVRKFTDADPAMQQFIVTIMAIVAAVGPLLAGVGMLIKNLTWLIPLVQAVIAVFGALLTWPGMIAAAIVALAVLIVRNWDWIKEQTAKLWETVTLYWDWLVDGITSGVSTAWDVTKEKFQNIADWVTEKIEWARDKVRDAIEAIKGFLNFQWKWPKIPIPKFTFSGSMNPFDWGSKGVPKIGITWNALGGIMNRPTIFGFDGQNLLGGGEAGPEAILPLTKSVLSDIGAGIVLATQELANTNNRSGSVVVIGDIELVVGTRTMARLLIDDIEVEREVKIVTEERKRGRKR